MGGDPHRRPHRGADRPGEERERVVDAFARAAADRGYAGLRTVDVARYAGVSLGVVEGHFESVEQGLAAAQQAFLDQLWLDAAAACEAPGEWPARVRAALAAVLASLVEASPVARAFAVEATAASIAAANRQLVALERFAAMLEEGRRQHPAAASLPAVTERVLVGGVASIVSARLLTEEAAALPALEPELLELLLLPYLGEAEARRVART